MLSLVVASLAANAQQRPPKFPEWDPHPQMHPIPPAYFNEHAVMIFHDERRDYVYEGTDVTEYVTMHMLVKVLDRTGIESFNTIPVPSRSGQSRVDSIKARTILPDGTTRDLKYEMLYGMGPNASGGFLFALDGLEKNAEVEIKIKYKFVSSFFGSVHFQYPYPVLHTFFELNYPKEMTFNTKGYHGFPSGKEEVVGGHKQVKLYVPDIPTLEEQPMSFHDLYLMRLDYGIDHFESRGGYQRYDAYTWDKLAQDLYKKYYRLKKEDTVAVNKFLTSLGIYGGESELEKIRIIENGIKDSIVVYDYLPGRNTGKIDTMLAKKSASADGIVKLFAACFKVARINHQIGAISDRREHLLDPKFVNTDPLDDMVFYFPNLDKYLDPNERFLRYPEISSTMINNKGVFSKTNPEAGFDVGSQFIAADAIMRMIPAPKASYSKSDLDAVITFNGDLDPEAEVSYSYTGYEAVDLRTSLAAANDEKKKKIIEKAISIADKRERIVRYNTVNEAYNSATPHKPLQIKATVKIPQMMDKAGNRYMFRIGDILGDKMDFYDTKRERVLPVDLDYAQSQKSVITFNIPKGFKVINPEALRTTTQHNDRNDTHVTASFSSDYRVEGGKIIVTVKEEYNQLHYTVYDFEGYRKVVNAAADFNKISLLLEPIKGWHPAKKAKPKAAPAKAAPGRA